jgi:formylglycine-generating enzyme required for sulfatase activity
MVGMLRLAGLLVVAGLVACSSAKDAATVPVAEDAQTAGSDGKPADPKQSTDATTPNPDGSSKEGEDPTIKSVAPSCARQHGGQTCGADGNEDCCQVAQQGDSKIGKYMVTAGRMRTFVEHFKGDIAGYVKSLPADKWKSEWNIYLIPTDVDSANTAFGPSGKKACEQGGFTGHTYWTPKTDDDFSDFSQDVLDEKALNCVPWELMQALCIWDGGHLATVAELKAAFTNSGSTKFPWGNDDISSVTAPDDQNRLNIEGAFETDPLPKDFRARDDGKPEEISFIIAPPGRFPNGNNKAGIADSAGNLLEWAGDQPRQFIWKADFEEHAKDAHDLMGGSWFQTARNGLPIGNGTGPWIWGDSQLFGNAGTSDQKDGYYSIGGRCAF